MVSKKIVIRSRPNHVVLLKKSEQCELRDVYRGGNPRPNIPTAINVLNECKVTDEDIIIRPWAHLLRYYR
jgi:hypothetical protein